LGLVAALTIATASADAGVLLDNNGPIVNGVGGADESLVQTDLGLVHFGVYCHVGSVTSGRRADEFTIDIGPRQIDRIVVSGFETGDTPSWSSQHPAGGRGFLRETARGFVQSDFRGASARSGAGYQASVSPDSKPSAKNASGSLQSSCPVESWVATK
jgi:hypothetical protein